MKAVRDTFWGGRLVLWQPARGHGYRFNLDPVLLASFVMPGKVGLDLGAGCGILSILLLAAGVLESAIAVEVQPELADLARRNVAANNLCGRMQVVQADLRSLQLGCVDQIVFNPPYFVSGAGGASPYPGRDAGRREVNGSLEDFVACAARHALPTSSTTAVVRSERQEELIELYLRHGLHPRRLRAVHSRSGKPAQHVLLAAGSEGPLTSYPSLAVHPTPGRRDFSPEVEAWVEGTIPGFRALSSGSIGLQR